MKLAAKMMPSAQKAKLVLTTRMLEFRDVNVLKVFYLVVNILKFIKALIWEIKITEEFSTPK